MVQLVGRNTELAHAGAWLDRLPHSGGGFAVRGEAGIGKSALLDVVIRRATARGVHVIGLTATESEASLPYAALQQILHPYFRQPDSMRARPRSVLGRALGFVEGAVPDLLAVGVAVLEVLADAAPVAGLLLAVDDAQWMDDSTARVLAFVARRLAEDPVVGIFAVRTGHDSPLLHAGLETIELDVLPEGAAAELLRIHRPDLLAQEHQRVLQTARGNPLGLLELPADFAGGEEETLAERLYSAFLDRVRGVAEPTRALMLVAALSDDNAVSGVEAAGVALGFSPVEIRGALEEAEGTGAVDLVGGRCTFRHPLVRSAIISAAPDHERRSAHRSLADALHDTPERAIWHRAASIVGADEEVAAALEVTALAASRQGDVSVSLRAWGVSVRMSTDRAASQRRLLRLAEAAMEAGRPYVAAEAFSQVDPAALGDVDAGRHALVGLAIEPAVVRPRQLRQVIGRAHKVLAAGEVDLAIALILAVGEELGTAGIGGDAALMQLARDIVDALPEPDTRRLVVMAASDPVGHAGRVAHAVPSLEDAELTDATELLVRTRLNVDADPDLASMQRRLLESYRSHGRLRSIASLQPIHTWIEICLANWPEALKAAEEGTRLAVELGIPRWGTGTLIGEGFIAALRGDHDRADELILEAEQGATAAGAHNVLTGVQLTRGVNHVARGRYEEALTALLRPFDPEDPSQHPVQAGWGLGDIAEAAAHLGRIDDVRHLFRRDPEAPTTPWREMAEAYASPFLAEGPELREAAYLDALSGVVAAWPTYHARLLLDYGSWLRRQRRTRDARARLSTARDRADALAMRPWAERARSELRALGTTSLPPVFGAWEPLSPQELQVADLAAQGMSNREIGERLFLSHRTVGSHLYRIYPKLGITNRAQLFRALHPHPEG